MSEYAIEMLGITKRFPGIIANDNITLQLKKGEIHKDGKKVEINNPNDANDLGIGIKSNRYEQECRKILRYEREEKHHCNNDDRRRPFRTRSCCFLFKWH